MVNSWLLIKNINPTHSQPEPFSEINCVKKSMCGSLEFKQGMYVKFLPPALRKLSFISSLISSSVSIQSEEKAGAITAMFLIPSCASSATFFTV